MSQSRKCLYLWKVWEAVLGKKGECSLHPAEAQAWKPCPAGHYCPGMSESHPGVPQACPEHTYLATEGGQSPAECLPCPAGYHCPWPGKGPFSSCQGYLGNEWRQAPGKHWRDPIFHGVFPPGLSSFEDYPCPPGHWCPGAQGAFLCPPGTFRSEPGASSPEECELCPSGYYCPDTQVTGRANVFAIPCQSGSECPAGEPIGPPSPVPLPFAVTSGAHNGWSLKEPFTELRLQAYMATHSL